MRRILKYYLKQLRFEVPRGSSFLKVGLDLENNICFWAEVDPEEKDTEVWEFEMYWTGEIFKKDNLLYLDSINDGMYIWHIYFAVIQNKIDA